MLARMLQYANGQPMREGDAVRVGRGRKATIIELVTDREQIESRKLSGPGVVLETETEGVEFHSVDWMRTEPLAFAGTGATEQSVYYGRAVVAVAGVLVPIALWSFFSALYAAWSTGHVVVMALGEVFEEVPWHLGWARFIGPASMLTGVVVALDSARRSMLWWLGVVMAGTGVVMLAYSAMFASLVGGAWVTGIAAFLPLTFWIDRRIGRTAAFFFMLATVLGLVALAAKNF
jgi:hypothetical protein